MARPCTPVEFVRRWPHALRPLRVPSPRPALPREDLDLLVDPGLPRQVTIRGANDVTLRFADEVTPLATAWRRDLDKGLLLSVEGHRVGEMPAAWSRFWHVGDQEYLQGGGWLAIEEPTGHLVVIDLDQAVPVRLLSAGVARLLATLALFLAPSGGPFDRAATVRLRGEIRGQDAVPVAELEPFWLGLVDEALDGDPVDFEVLLA